MISDSGRAERRSRRGIHSLCLSLIRCVFLGISEATEMGWKDEDGGAHAHQEHRISLADWKGERVRFCTLFEEQDEYGQLRKQQKFRQKMFM